MIINLKRVANQIEEKKAGPVPGRLSLIRPAQPAATPTTSKPIANPVLDEFNKVKTDRAKLSNRIMDEVQRGASKEELKDLVDDIKSYQPRLEKLYDQSRHVDQYGKLPQEVTPQKQEPAPDTWALKDKKRKLSDKRSKLLKKLAGGEWTTSVNSTGELSLDANKKAVARNAKKQKEWQDELDQVNAEYAFVDDQLKRLEGKV